jgi:hypothetical protein
MQNQIRMPLLKTVNLSKFIGARIFVHADWQSDSEI